MKKTKIMIPFHKWNAENAVIFDITIRGSRITYTMRLCCLHLCLVQPDTEIPDSDIMTELEFRIHDLEMLLGTRLEIPSISTWEWS